MRRYKARQPNLHNYCAMGDSQTAERSALGGARLDQTYPMLAAQAFGYGACTNLGISGNTTSQMSARNPQLLAHTPDVASVMGFVNDLSTNIPPPYTAWMGGGITPAITKSNLRAMVVAHQLQKTRVTLITAVPVFQNVYLDNAGPYLTAIREIPGETGCEFIDFYAYLLSLTPGERAPYMLDDQHQNALGHQLLFNLRSNPTYSTAKAFQHYAA